MTKRKAGVPEPEASDERYLEHGDHVALLLADKEAAVADALLARECARLEVYRLEAEKKADQWQRTIDEQSKVVFALNKRRRDLAAELAERYGIDWDSYALEPMTGKLEAIPEDQ